MPCKALEGHMMLPMNVSREEIACRYIAEAAEIVFCQIVAGKRELGEIHQFLHIAIHVCLDRFSDADECQHISTALDRSLLRCRPACCFEAGSPQILLPTERQHARAAQSPNCLPHNLVKFIGHGEMPLRAVERRVAHPMEGKSVYRARQCALRGPGRQVIVPDECQQGRDCLQIYRRGY